MLQIRSIHHSMFYRRSKFPLYSQECRFFQALSLTRCLHLLPGNLIPMAQKSTHVLCSHEQLQFLSNYEKNLPKIAWLHILASVCMFLYMKPPNSWRHYFVICNFRFPKQAMKEAQKTGLKTLIYSAIVNNHTTSTDGDIILREVFHLILLGGGASLTL